MQTGTVVRDDNRWQGHPDVAYFEDKLWVVYRESAQHKAKGYTKIQLVVSSNGNKFSDPVTLFESGGDSRFNCPRISVVKDELCVICDQLSNRPSEMFFEQENNTENMSLRLFKSPCQKNATISTIENIRGIVPDRLIQFKEQSFLAAHHQIGLRAKQCIYHNGKDTFPAHPSLNLCEGNLFVWNDVLYIIMRENSQTGKPAYVSKRKGEKWTKPSATRLFGCHRPTAGVLSSGRVLVTYREQTSVFDKWTWARNTFSCLSEPDSKMDFKKSIILPLDHDRNKKPDGGYTGWVQLPDDAIYVVNYITDDAPKPYIKWYMLKESDFSL